MNNWNIIQAREEWGWLGKDLRDWPVLDIVKQHIQDRGVVAESAKMARREGAISFSEMRHATPANFDPWAALAAASYCIFYRGGC